MKKRELFSLWDAIVGIKDCKPHIKFAYAIAKNKRIIQQEIDDLRALIELSEDMDEYEKKRRDLCMVCAERNEFDEPIINNNKFQIKDKDSFRTEVDKLKETFADAIEEHENKIKAYEEILEEEVDIDFHRVKYEYFPHGLTQGQYDILLYFAADD